MPQSMHAATRHNVQYSEAHMGFGEARVMHLVTLLETLPEKCLVLIEEPETSLHPSAQYELGSYLVSVSSRRGHQIMLTTHSAFLLQALPAESRIYLEQSPGGIMVTPGLTALQAQSLMTHGEQKGFHILVEDDCACAILREILLRGDPNLLKTAGIYPAGDAKFVARSVQVFHAAHIPAAAVRDADKGDVPKDSVFSLPGSQPPEREVFESRTVREYLAHHYDLDWADFGVTLQTDHHTWFAALARRLNMDKSALLAELAREYVRGLAEAEVQALVTLLQEAC